VCASLDRYRSHGYALEQRYLQDCEPSVSKPPIVGTLIGVFDGALDGIKARLILKTRLGYTVELLASRGAFHHGDRVELSPKEFLMDHERVLGRSPHTLHD